MKFYIGIFLLLISLSSNAQKFDSFKKMDALLNESDYKEFFVEISKLELNDKYIGYLKSKESEYRVPLYWLMANYYANKGNEKEMHKWLYVAVIMTQQDAELCNDKTARYASQKLLKYFPKILEVKNKTSYEIANGMNSAIFFINNIRGRKDPSWACSYGENEVNHSVKVLIDREFWEKERERIFRKYTKDYAK